MSEVFGQTHIQEVEEEIIKGFLSSVMEKARRYSKTSRPSNRSLHGTETVIQNLTDTFDTLKLTNNGYYRLLEEVAAKRFGKNIMPYSRYYYFLKRVSGELNTRRARITITTEQFKKQWIGIDGKEEFTKVDGNKVNNNISSASSSKGTAGEAETTQGERVLQEISITSPNEKISGSLNINTGSILSNRITQQELLHLLGSLEGRLQKKQEFNVFYQTRINQKKIYKELRKNTKMGKSYDSLFELLEILYEEYSSLFSHGYQRDIDKLYHIVQYCKKLDGTIKQRAYLQDKKIINLVLEIQDIIETGGIMLIDA